MADFSSILKSAPIGLFMLFGTYLAARRRKSGWAKARAEYPSLAERLGLAHKVPTDASKIGSLRGTYRGHEVFVDPDERLRIVVYLRGEPPLLLRTFAHEKRTPPNHVRLETGTPWLDSYFKDRFAAPDVVAPLRDVAPELAVVLKRAVDGHPERITHVSVTPERLECALDFGRPAHVPADTVLRLLPDLVDAAELVEGGASPEP